MGKKIFMLGGAGNMGSELTRGLLSFDEISVITIGDTNMEAADRLAKELNDPRVNTVYVDVTDVKDATEKVKGYDMLMNATYFAFFDYALQVACDAKVTYADLASSPTAEQREMVAKAGITVMTGLGITPGLTNILAKYGTEQMDETDEIHIHFASFRTLAPSKGLLETIIWELATECPTRMYYLNGSFNSVPPLQGSKTVNFAEPLGPQVVYYVPHPETVSLSQNIPGIKYVSVRGTWRPQDMIDFGVLNRFGLLDPVEVEVGGNKVLVSDVTKERIWQKFGGKFDKNLWAFFINIEIIGKKDGKRKTITVNVSHPVEWMEKTTAKLTGIPAAVCTALMARHGSSKPGILYPEEYFSGTEFADEMKNKFPQIIIETVTTVE